MGFKEDDEYVVRVVEARRNRLKGLVAEFRRCNGPSGPIQGKFKLPDVNAYYFDENDIVILLKGGRYIISDRNPELESKLNNFHLY